MQLSNIRQLTEKDVIAIEEYEVKSDDFEAFDIVIASDCYSDEELVEKDFIIGEVTINGVTYNVIHGFPGDEPNGVIYTSDFSTIVGLHWSGPRGLNPLLDWYLEIITSINDRGEEETDIPKSWFVGAP